MSNTIIDNYAKFIGAQQEIHNIIALLIQNEIPHLTGSVLVGVDSSNHFGKVVHDLTLRFDTENTPAVLLMRTITDLFPNVGLQGWFALDGEMTEWADELDL
tara:strand:- start:634 stop:939 length:306 start_codon:yes stop_codon:yes gene_type:complete